MGLQRCSPIRVKGVRSTWRDTYALEALLAGLADGGAQPAEALGERLHGILLEVAGGGQDGGAAGLGLGGRRPVAAEAGELAALRRRQVVRARRVLGAHAREERLVLLLARRRRGRGAERG